MSNIKTISRAVVESVTDLTHVEDTIRRYRRSESIKRNQEKRKQYHRKWYLKKIGLL